MTTATAPTERLRGPADDGTSLLKTLQFYRSMTTDAVGTLHQRFERYGDLYHTTSRGASLFVTRHPDHAYQVLVTNAQDWGKRDDLAMYLGEGLLNSEGELWRRQRRLMQPSFRRDRITSYGTMMAAETKRLLAGWRDGAQIDLCEQMMLLTMRVVCRALFGHESDRETEEVGRLMSTFQETATALDLFPQWVPTPLHRRQQKGIRAMDQFIYGLIERARAKGDGDNLLMDLLRASDEQGGMSEKLLRDELVTMFLAGHETTSLALTWTFHLLANNPDVETKMHAEIDAVLDDGRAVTAADFERFPYTKRVLQESMRLHPPAYVLARLARKDTDIAGHRVPRGSELVVWIYHIHHDERWFPEADRFDPDRFAEGSDGVKHPHAFIPFGAGSRTCIGRHFAMFEAVLILASIVRHYRLHSTGQRIVLDPRVTLRPKGGLMMNVERRPA